MDTTVRPSKDHGYGTMTWNTGNGETQVCRRCGGHLDDPKCRPVNPNPIPGQQPR